jgi:atypical dual specificity phosphatase
MTLIGNIYRWFYGRFVNKPTNFSWIIPGKLAGTGLPVTHEEFEWIMKQGIKTIVTVREVPLPSSWVHGIVDYSHLKVEDYGSPNIEELRETVAFIQRQISDGKPVVVHCAAGKGRTGEVLAAYLMMSEKLTAREAIAELRKLRPGSVQSEAQEQALQMYGNYLQALAEAGTYE